MNPQQLAEREKEIQQAVAAYPGYEIGQAYALWKKAKGEEPIFLDTASMNARREEIKKFVERPCPNEQCGGIQILQAICSGSLEGQAGFNSCWTCPRCWTRELSEKDFSDWFIDVKS